ncbi:MAG: flavin reductase family protein [candidate division KSB1 bacterium]|nr:flavin reductase family protein [candidate division KSB1 bacterium]
MPIDSNLFRQVMSRFATGITIVTTRAGETIHGLTVNSFCSVSLDPPLVLICVDKRAHSHDLIVQGGNFAVNFLTATQEEIARRFATNNLPASKRFAGVQFRTEVTGAPIFDESLGWLDCQLFATYPGGDHSIFVGEVVALGQTQEQTPLLYFRSTYQKLDPVF